MFGSSKFYYVYYGFISFATTIILRRTNYLANAHIAVLCVHTVHIRRFDN